MLSCTVRMTLLLAMASPASMTGLTSEQIVSEANERPLSGHDRLSISLHPVEEGIDELSYILVSSGEQCLLRRLKTHIPIRRCQELQRTLCHDEHVLFHKEVTEDCSKEQEFCQTHYRSTGISSQTFVCQTPDPHFRLASCDRPNESSQRNQTVCVQNVVSFCQKKPVTVTVTEKRQLCNGTDKATKICVTYTDGAWSCRNLTSSHCDDLHVTKVIDSEIARLRLDCQEKELPPICQLTNCSPTEVMAISKTFCVTDTLPLNVTLREVVCQKCVQGRVQMRPVLETRPVCRNKTEQFCLTVNETETVWKKWCSRPSASDVDAVPAHTSGHDQPPAEIELAPGEWIRTNDKVSERLFLRVQQRNQNTLAESAPPAGTTTSATPSFSAGTAEAIGQAASASPRATGTKPLLSIFDLFLQNIRHCVKEPYNCKIVAT